jgi:hypothetical protein
VSGHTPLGYDDAYDTGGKGKCIGRHEENANAENGNQGQEAQQHRAYPKEHERN